VAVDEASGKEEALRDWVGWDCWDGEHGAMAMGRDLNEDSVQTVVSSLMKSRNENLGYADVQHCSVIKLQGRIKSRTSG